MHPYAIQSVLPTLTWKYLFWKPTDIEEPSDECNDVHHNDLGHEELERGNLYPSVEYTGQ